MKKEYSKPTISITELSLSQQIASCGGGSRGNCNPFGQATSGTAGACAFQMNQFGKAVFTEAVHACKKKVPEGVSCGGVCYNTVAAGYTIFSS